jgi:hypothetical protein
MFRKLKSKSKFDYEIGKKQISYGDVINYYDVVLKAGDALQVIPERYRKDFCLSFMQIAGEVPPHTDSEIKVTINFYVDPGSYMTKFFRVKEGATIHQIENQTNGVLFDKKDLTHCGTFIANEGDAWLLDVTYPHAVEAIKGVTRRSAICLATDKYSYDEVEKMLWETGY